MILMEMYAQYTVQKTAEMTKYSVLEHGTQSMVATARTHVSQRIPINGEKHQDQNVQDGALQYAKNMKSCVLQ